MIIEQGCVAGLTDLPWAGIEVSESRIEEVVYHIAKWAARELEGRAFQLVFPVKSRGLGGIELLSPYLWARVERLDDLLTIRSVMGVKGPVSDSEMTIIPVEDEFVQRVIEDTRRAAEGWSRGVKVGAFVRILLGDMRMLCGEVTDLRGSTATVKIALKTRDVKWIGSVRALLVLNVRKSEREYYYAN